MGKEKKRISTEETEKNINKTQNEKSDKLDALAVDYDNDSLTNAPEADSAQFEAFMDEYRDLMSKNITIPKVEEDIADEDESEFLISLPKKANQNKNAKKGKDKPVEKPKDENWDEGITLAPEHFEDPGEKDKIMHDEIPEDDPEPNFDLGEPIEAIDDKFQISINFEGEQKELEEEVQEKEFKYDPEKPRIIDWIFDTVEMFVFVLLAVMVITSFVFKHSIVEGDSMLNTLEDGDHLIISDLFYTPERGDIVVFEDYSTMLKKAVVKRIIGLPGETVEVKLNEYQEYEVYINGEFLEEEYAYTDIDFSAPGVGKWTIGEGEVFVMGDNRYNSTDSRDSRVGPVKIETILGKVIFRFYPFDKFGAVE